MLFDITQEDVKNGNVSHLPELVAEKGENNIANKLGAGLSIKKVDKE